MAYILKKAGLAFDEKKASGALTKSSIRLMNLIEAKNYNVKMKRAKVRNELESGMLRQAQIEIEQVIRDDVMINAYDHLRRDCNLVADRLSLIATSRECPYDLEQAVCTIIWAADHVDAPELKTVKNMLQKKFGKALKRKSELIEGGCVNQKVADKLSFQHINPPAALVEEMLITMSKECGVAYEPITSANRIKQNIFKTAGASSSPPTTTTGEWTESESKDEAKSDFFSVDFKPYMPPITSLASPSPKHPCPPPSGSKTRVSSRRRKSTAPAEAKEPLEPYSEAIEANMGSRRHATHPVTMNTPPPFTKHLPPPLSSRPPANPKPETKPIHRFSVNTPPPFSTQTTPPTPPYPSASKEAQPLSSTTRSTKLYTARPTTAAEESKPAQQDRDGAVKIGQRQQKQKQRRPSNHASEAEAVLGTVRTRPSAGQTQHNEYAPNAPIIVNMPLPAAAAAKSSLPSTPIVTTPSFSSPTSRRASSVRSADLQPNSRCNSFNTSTPPPTSPITSKRLLTKSSPVGGTTAATTATSTTASDLPRSTLERTDRASATPTATAALSWSTAAASGDGGERSEVVNGGRSSSKTFSRSSSGVSSGSRTRAAAPDDDGGVLSAPRKTSRKHHFFSRSNSMAIGSSTGRGRGVGDIPGFPSSPKPKLKSTPAVAGRTGPASGATSASTAAAAAVPDLQHQESSCLSTRVNTTRKNSRTFFRSNSFRFREGGEGRGALGDREAGILTTAPDTTNQSVQHLQRSTYLNEVTARPGGRFPSPVPEAIALARNDDDHHVSIAAGAMASTASTPLRARLKSYGRSLSFRRSKSMAGDSSSLHAFDTTDESNPAAATALAMPCLAEGEGGSGIASCPSDVFGNDPFDDDNFRNLPVATAVSSRKYGRVFSRSKSASVMSERLPADGPSGTLRRGGSLSATFQITGRNHLALPGHLVVYVTL